MLSNKGICVNRHSTYYFRANYFARSPSLLYTDRYIPLAFKLLPSAAAFKIVLSLFSEVMLSAQRNTTPPPFYKFQTLQLNSGGL